MDDDAHHHPYRSPSAREPGADPSAELFYRPRTTTFLSEGFGSFIAAFFVATLGGMFAGYVRAGVSIGLALGALAAAARRRRGDSAGILMRVDDRILEIRRGRRGARLALVTLEDVLDVKLHTESISSAPANVVPGPGFGVHRSGGGGSVDESRIAFHFQTRLHPLHLTAARVANMDATESVANIRRWLRAHGWIPQDERGGDGETDADPSTTTYELLAIGDYTLTAHARRFELILEEHDRSVPEGRPERITYVIGPEELPVVMASLLAESGERDAYAGLDDGEKTVALVRDRFVDAHGISAIPELKKWLVEREIPVRVAPST